ncbi:MAG: fused MFS/spermidine synthase [Planctomycetaceae bacterium]
MKLAFRDWLWAAHLGALLFVSGLCALIYQTVWFREFRLVFGGSSPAVAAVLAIFMGGLGLGNAVIGPRADRHRSPLLLYGLLEAAIAVCVALSPWLVEIVRGVYIASGGQTALGVFGATAYRLLLATIVLLVPTFLMGGTLPAAGKAITSVGDSTRRHVGWIYGWNTLGAVFGTMISTFWLLEHWGSQQTLWAACGVNFLIAVWAAIWSRFQPRDAIVPAPIASSENTSESSTAVVAVAEVPLVVAAAPAVPLDSANATLHDEPVSAGFLLSSAACVGFSFFVMELVWFRMLGPLLGGTTYTFGIILATALAGIGIGGLIYPLWFRTRAPSLWHFFLTCLLEAISLLVPFVWGDDIAVLTAMWRGRLADQFSSLVLGWLAVTGMVVFPAAIVSGVQFPILVSLMGRGRSRLGRQIGGIYAANTVGAIAGSLAGGFILLPQLSASGTWKSVVALLTAWGLCAGFLHWKRRPRLSTAGGLAAVLLLVSVLLASSGPTAVWRHSSIGAGRFRLPGTGKNELQSWTNMQRRRIFSETDGLEAGVGIVVTNSFSFMVNGKSDGNALEDSGTQIMLGVMGTILNPDAQQAMVIGLGTGESAGWLAATSQVKRLDVVELEPAVDEMARLCGPVNHHVLQNPRVRRLYNDAREVLLTTNETYDVIASEPSNPYRAGVSNLFTTEFYRAAQLRLRPGGLLLQWVQGYEIDTRTVATICRTLQSVFAHVEVWQTQTRDLLFVCGEAPPALSAEGLRQRIDAEENLRSALLHAWHAQTVESVLSHYVAGNRSVEEFAKRGTINTDTLNAIEYGFARTVGQRTDFRIDDLRRTAWEQEEQHRSDIADIDWAQVELERLLNSALLGHELPDDDVVLSQQSRQYRALNNYLSQYNVVWDARSLQKYDNAWRLWPNKMGPQSLLELEFLAHAKTALNHNNAEPLLRELEIHQPNEALGLLAVWYWQQGQSAAAIESLERLLENLKTDPWGMTMMISPAIELADELAEAEPAAAGRIMKAMSEPFAVKAYEDDRMRMSVNVSRFLPAERAVPSLSAFEPHPLWDVWFLTYREQVYRETGYALAPRAKQDLERFYANEGRTPDESRDEGQETRTR